MRKRKAIALIVAVLVLASACALLLAACDDGTATPAGKGVTRPENVFTNDIDQTNGENLVAGASVTASSAQDGVSALTDGDKETAWTAESTEDEYVEIRFSAPTEINTVVLRENGNYITGFRFLKEDDGAWTEFYRQDRMERYRYCTFDAETVSAIRITFDGANAGRSISLSEIEIYNLAPKTYEKEFMVTSYMHPNDYAEAMAKPEELKNQLSVVTDVILFNFLYWDAEGNLVFTQSPGDPDSENDADYLVQAASDIKAAAAEAGYEVRICVDLWPQNISEHGLPQNKDKLIEQLIDAAEAYDIDGYEFDWEYPANATEWVYYGDLLADLSDALEDTYVSVALSNFNVGFTESQIERIDYVQIMGYDRFDVDGNNASFRSGAYLPMRYFVNLGFKPSQLIAGMPAYGRPDTTKEEAGGTWTDYDYGEVWGSSDKSREYTYWDNVQWINYPAYSSTELLDVYVTGAAMAADKTAYAIEQGFAGVMIFRGMEDMPFDKLDSDGHSLSITKAIGDTIADRIA